MKERRTFAARENHFILFGKCVIAEMNQLQAALVFIIARVKEVLYEKTEDRNRQIILALQCYKDAEFWYASNIRSLYFHR